MAIATCCRRRELVRDDEGSDFYCKNCGAVVPNPRISAVSRWAGVLLEEVLREAIFVGCTSDEEVRGGAD